MKEIFKKYIEQLQRLLKTEKKQRLILIMLVIGVLFILITNTLQKKVTPSVTSNEIIKDEQAPLIANIEQLEESYEKNLAALLNSMSNIQDVEVMVNIDSTNISIYETDTIYQYQTTEETDKNGGNRLVDDEKKEKKVVFMKEGNKDIPILIQTKKPEVRGVLIVARGVDNVHSKQQVIEAVSRVLDVPSYRVSVVSK